jgi:hypothetical protein
MRPTEVCRTTAALRGLYDGVRPLPQAIADVTVQLESEFNAPDTSLRRRTEIIERLALLRSISTMHGG